MSGQRSIGKTTAALAALATWVVTGCGGPEPGAGTREFVTRLAAATPSARIASVAPGVDTEALLDWAQWRFPSLFPAGVATVEIVHEGRAYSVRAYPGGNHLGVSRQGEVFGLGDFTGGRLESFGPVAGFAAQVRADRCQVYPQGCGAPNSLDVTLRRLIEAEGLTGDPTVGRSLPNIADALPQLGKLLFFSKSLSVQRDTACASCHHPTLGGGDGLGVSIGTDALQPDLVGPGRRRADGQLLVARNANTFFNTALYDRVLFADGRIESLAAGPSPGGEGTPIRTPDGAADPLAGPNLLAAQARFPITGVAEMRGTGLPAMSDHALREFIAERLASEAAAQPEGQGWLPHFRRAFGRPDGSARELITFDRIMLAIAEYQRSAVFVKSPWQRYVLGENRAIDLDAKRGAIRFFTRVEAGGRSCSVCHKGDFFTDERFHPIAFPQTGPGFAANGADAGRARVTGAARDLQAFRTPSLLNVELTGPYGHAGNYASLFTVNRHYVFEGEEVRDLLATRGWCMLAPYTTQPGCTSATADAERESLAAVDRMLQRRNEDPADALPVIDRNTISLDANFELERFMQSLTDPCLKDRACLARWIPRPDEAPDAHQLNAVDAVGRLR